MRCLVGLLFVIASPGLLAQQPRAIPLQDIWAYGFSCERDFDAVGHRNLRDIDTIETKVPLTQEDKKKSAFWTIHRALSIRTEQTPGPAKAFLVDGTGKEALIAARDRFVTGKEPELTAGVEKSLIVFAYASGTYTPILESVVVYEGVVQVSYRYVLRTSNDIRRYLAVVPIGDYPWPSGEIAIRCTSVVDREGRPGPVHHDLGLIMCRPSTFTIKQE